MKKLFKHLKRVLIAIAAILIVVVIAFSIYVGNYYHSNVSVNDFKDTLNIEVKDNSDIILTPLDNDYDREFIFYPGAKVESSAYLELCASLALEDSKVVLLKMPFNLAFFGINYASNYIENDVNTYIIGHSLGGSMAARYVSNNSEVSGLILLASYSIDKISQPTLLIYGSNDKVLNLDNYKKNLENLENKTEIVIDGGNHSGFANYGAQKGDGERTISGSQQVLDTVNYITEFVKGVENKWLINRNY